ncbi:porin family protein [Iodidimonas sp. SYSU 1G8]|uniref:outer membrane protein n=1 Tax=Iodidimonas sp. SYSU 1G8 TaxID=3133967 RepID=UPI0031FED599
MRKSIMGLAVVTVAVAATPSLAQDAGAARTDGFRIEAHGGWDRVSVPQLGGKSGVAYGVGLGYDFALSNNFFMGVEGNIDDSSTKACVNSIFIVGDRTCAKTGLDLSGVVRLGFTQDNAKLYVLGAYTRAKIKATYDNGVTTTSVGDWGDGWRVGAGYQLNFASGLYGKIEYHYSDYQGGFKRHNVIAGIGYQF